MLTIKVEDQELYDQEANQFITVIGGTFHFEHSLRAMSKWEEKYEKPFLVERHDPEELKDYFCMMCLDDGFSQPLLTDDVIAKLNDYVAAKHTATRITSRDGPNNGSVQTTEVIYASMAMAQVPFDCDTWNINRLLMVLSVIAERSNPPKKMSRGEILQQNADLNRQRRAALKSKG